MFALGDEISSLDCDVIFVSSPLTNTILPSAACLSVPLTILLMLPSTVTAFVLSTVNELFCCTTVPLFFVTVSLWFPLIVSVRLPLRLTFIFKAEILKLPPTLKSTSPLKSYEALPLTTIVRSSLIVITWLLPTLIPIEPSGRMSIPAPVLCLIRIRSPPGVSLYSII